MEHPKQERTFVAIKADGLHRALVGDIIKRFEQVGLKIIGVKMTIPTEQQVVDHYGKDDVWCQKKGDGFVENMKAKGEEPTKPAIEYGRDIIRQLVDYMTASPVVAMVLEGNESVGIVKKLVGGTEPLTSDVGTIRGDYMLDSYPTANRDYRAVRNIVHCSDEPSEAEREIKLWFSDNELIDYTHVQEKMLYDVNIDGILE